MISLGSSLKLDMGGGHATVLKLARPRLELELAWDK